MLADVDDFVAWVQGRRERYEFVGGRLTMMAGGSEDHSDIQVNLLAALKRRLQGGPASRTAASCWCESTIARAGLPMRA